MCGLVGIAGTLEHKHLKTFQDLLIMSSLRGQDSTGVASISRANGTVELAKCVGVPFNLIGSKRWDNTVKHGMACLIGHTRARTVGAVNTANAHPFAFTNVVGAHNGTLDYEARGKLPFFKSCDTDSEALIEAISTEGVEAVIPRVSGAWALSFYDARNDTINLLRNDKRPLYFCFADEGKVLLWASELYFLFAAMARNDVKLHDKVYNCTVDWMFSWKLPKYGDKFLEYVGTEIKGGQETPPFYDMTEYGNGTYYTYDQRTRTTRGGQVGSTTGSQGGVTKIDKDERTTAKTTGTSTNQSSSIFGKIPHRGPVGLPPAITRGGAENIPFLGTPGLIAQRLQAITGEPVANSLTDNGSNSGNNTAPKPVKPPAPGYPIKYDEVGRDSLEKILNKGLKAPTTLVRPIYKDHRTGVIINQMQFEVRTRDGCSSCGDKAHWGEDVKFVGPGPQDHVCEGCQHDKDVVDFFQIPLLTTSTKRKASA